MVSVYVDLESVPPEWSQSQIDVYVRSAVPGNYKKPEAIEGWIAENRDHCFGKLACDWRYLRTIAVAVYAPEVGFDHVVYNRTDEQELFFDLGRRFGELRDEAGSSGLQLKGWNSDMFDQPVLRRRAAKYKLNALTLQFGAMRDLKRLLVNNREEPEKTGLHDFVKFLGLRDVSPFELTGAGVWDAYKAHRDQEIKQHARQDVHDLASVDEAFNP